jgi:penicillin-binding protein-related factor A (putative recombinase)
VILGLEQNLWKWLRKEVQPLIKSKELHICRIENLVGAGYPDVEGCYDGCHFHIELKALARPKRKSTPLRVKFQPRQIPWLKKRWTAGGNCWVLLRVGTKRDAKHYLVPGNNAHLLNKISEAQLAKLSEIDCFAPGIEIIKEASRYLDA